MNYANRGSTVLRIALALLLPSAAFGQWWQRQPGGPATAAILTIVKDHCPAAAERIARPTVADGARAIDRWAFRRFADRLRHDGRDRCRR